MVPDISAKSNAREIRRSLADPALFAIAAMCIVVGIRLGNAGFAFSQSLPLLQQSAAQNVLGDAPMYAGRTDFRSTASRYAWTAVLAIGLCAATYLIYSSDGFTWISLSFMAFSVIGVLAVLEALTSYVRIDGNVLRLCRTFRQYSVEKAEIETISSAKGCPMLLVMRDGSKLEVPSLGANSIENSLRAWLRAA